MHDTKLEEPCGTPKPELVLPPDWHDLVEILGRPNFQCGAIAHVMRDSGWEKDLPPKAEHEQACVIHWLLRLRIWHGEQWGTVAARQLSHMRRRLPVTDKRHPDYRETSVGHQA